MNLAIGPEKAACPLPIMSESARIRDLLLSTHTRIEQDSEPHRKNIEEDIRLHLGYEQADEVDLSDLVDVRADKQPMIPPWLLAAALPLSARSADTTRQARNELAAIYAHDDDRLVAIVGECAVYNVEATMKYAQHVQTFIKLFPNLKILQRIFFEKPRTFKAKGEEKSWKGLLYDPLLDGSYDINRGAVIARMLACRITDLGNATVKEQLNAQTPQITDGLIAQDNLGARNAHDQKAMEFSSATSAIAGHKNSVEGDIEIAAAAAATAHGPHTFLGMDYDGRLCIVSGRGNPTAHFILRGGKSGPNYSPESIEKSKKIAEKLGLIISLAVDASHGNSGGNHENQPTVVDSVSDQIADGEGAIRAVHMETALVAGNQPFEEGKPLEEYEYGKSITDKCAGLDVTVQMLSRLDEAAAKRREKKLRQSARPY